MPFPRSELLVVGSIDPETTPDGKTFPKNLPPHITVFPWFQVFASHSGMFSNCLSRIAARHAHLEATVGEEDLFGPEKNISVRRMLAVAGIRQIHRDIHAITKTFSAGVQNPEWVGDGYVPHITQTEGLELRGGQRVIIPELQLVERTPGEKLKIIYSTHKLGESDEQAAA